MTKESGTAPMRLTIAASIPRISALTEVLQCIEHMDDATSRGDSLAVEAFVAEDFVLSGPGNRFMNRAEMLAAIGRAAASGSFHYTSYERVVEHVCCRDDLVVLMGLETTVSEGGRPELEGKAIQRRFTDVWCKEGGLWKHLARQSTII